MYRWATSICLFALISSHALAAPNEPVRFSRDVLPLLSEKCLSCHGQDPKGRMAGLRLDTREGATAVRKTGTAIVPGKPQESLLLARVRPSDPKRMMPPAYSHKAPLNDREVALLRAWIEQGAPWGKHWSFEVPVRPEIGSAKTKHPIDVLVERRLARENLRLAPEAARHVLARRLAFDLTGMPPAPETLAAFLQDRAPGAYERFAGELLASPHYGERMAMWWLDAARYADTDGFQADATRFNWPWRDWVVAAFNRNQRFDQFTMEQLAGDLLPNATADQKLATAFHRNHMTNGEGGRDPEESRIDYVLDRVNTTGTVWLGLTLGCTQCHSHKFDPISHHDYYSLSAFFNSIDEDGRAGKNAKPYLSYESPYAARSIAEAARLVDERKPREAQARRDAEKPFGDWLNARFAEVRGGFAAWRPLRALALESAEGSRLAQDPASLSIEATGPNPRQDDYRVVAEGKPLGEITGIKLEVLPPLTRGAAGEFILTDIKVQVRRRGSSQVRDVLVSGAIADYSADKAKNDNYGDVKDTLDDDPRNGWTTKGASRDVPHTALYALAEPLTLTDGEELVFEMRQRSTRGDANIARFRISVTGEPGPAVRSLEPAPRDQLARASSLEALDAKVRERLFEQFLTGYAPYVAAKAALDLALRQLDEIKGAGKVDVMVLAERAQPRDTHVLLRGVWDKKGDVVKPDVIPAIAPWPQDAERNRLGLARWIVSRENPLTARVIVNQIWQLFFGAGLVRTTEDFGLQGEQPEHAELLDWLAVEFVESGWDVKHLVKLIVTSATYRQSSLVTPALLERDPENRLLARGARFRLPSWMLRDAALRYAGLLNPALGGPPARPYQPPGVWEELFMGRFKYEPSEGPAQYRRTLYAFWRRSIAPTFLFDTAQRRSCEVRISRTNTPLQALTLLNDETYLEAARTIASGTKDVAAIFARVVGRAPHTAELAVLQREYDRARRYYAAHRADAEKLLTVGQSPSPTATAEQAAAMVVASMTLNLDEAITHE